MDVYICFDDGIITNLYSTLTQNEWVIRIALYRNPITTKSAQDIWQSCNLAKGKTLWSFKKFKLPINKSQKKIWMLIFLSMPYFHKTMCAGCFVFQFMILSRNNNWLATDWSRTIGIVVGNTFRRLVCRTIARQFADELQSATAPFIFFSKYRASNFSIFIFSMAWRQDAYQFMRTFISFSQ